MAVKWMNALVVLMFVLLLLANKEYFISEAAEKPAALGPIIVEEEEQSSEIMSGLVYDIDLTLKKEVVSENTVIEEETDINNKEGNVVFAQIAEEASEILVDSEPDVTAEQVEPTEQVAQAEKEFILHVRSGMGSKHVSEQLVKIGLIEDKESLNRYLMAYGYATKIQIGEYKLNKKMSFEEIARTITSR